MLSSDNDDTMDLFNKFQKQIDGSKTANPFSNAFYEKILPQIKNYLRFINNNINTLSNTQINTNINV